MLSTSKPGRYSDGHTLYLLVAETGAKSWVQRITIDGRRRDMGLGGFPLVSLAKARARAMANRVALSAGRDPFAEKRSARTKASARSPRARPSPRSSAPAPASALANSDRNRTPTELHVGESINDSCLWSGRPVRADSLTTYGGQVVGFCNPGCRDKFAAAVRHFERAAAQTGDHTPSPQAARTGSPPS